MKESHPPRLAQKILRQLYSSKRHGVMGDTNEEYKMIRVAKGRLVADLWYIAQIFLPLPYLIKSSLSWSLEMFRNHLKITRRIIRKHTGYSFINIFGLALGMACCVVIMLFVQEEMSFDRFHKNADRIFRIREEVHSAGIKRDSIRISSWVAPAIIQDFPEVEDAVRMIRWSGKVRVDDKQFDEKMIFFADPSFLKIFSFPLLEGDPASALDSPDSILISKSLVGKYFGDKPALGRVLTVGGKQEFKITGILADFPKNSHIQMNFLGNFAYARHIWGDDRFSKERIPSYTYLLLDNPASSQGLETKFPGFMTTHKGEQYAETFKLFLQPLTSIHLNSHYSIEITKNSKISYTYALSAVALIIMLIACVNYINLSTARASQRSLEVGVRKAVGANKKQLIQQFIGESVLMAFLALVTGLLLATAVLPFFNSVMERNLHLDLQGNLFFYLGLLGLTLIVGLLSGSYPALYLSSFAPVGILKGRSGLNRKDRLWLRKGLVIVQYFLSSAFIIGTLLVARQMSYVENKDLGFAKDRVHILPPPIKRGGGYEAFKADLLSSPYVEDLTASTGPLGWISGMHFMVKGEDIQDPEGIQMDYMGVDHNFFQFYGIKVIQGRDFSPEIQSDKGKAIILNESAVKKLGWESPLGKTLDIMDGEFSGTVIGVVPDFHNISLHESIRPVIYNYEPQMIGELAVRLAPHKTREALQFLKKKWSEWAPDNLFYSSALEDSLDAMYREDQKVKQVFLFASALSIIISGLGLLGLSIFATQQRVKEIGIRKVMGASIPGIVSLLCRDFGRSVFFANLIAWPVIYLIIRRWLDNFAYHAGISPWLFFLGGGLTFMAAFLAVGFQVLKTALANPVDSLRYE